MSEYNSFETGKILARPFLVNPINNNNDVCNFCGDSSESGTHTVFLPVRYEGRVICDNCACLHDVQTECCGRLGEEHYETVD
jgi:hypothetical protein